MLRTGSLALALAILPFVAAYGATTPPSQAYPQVQAAQAEPSWTQPDLISLGSSFVDFDKTEPKTQSTDFRLEYRWGTSLASGHNDWFHFGIHPMAGMDVSTRSQIYGFGGLAFDLLFWKHVVFTESEAVGLFDSGNAKPMGSFIEFRSQAELGWRFDNDMRLTGQISHISNAGITRHNPGEEIVGGYLHIPVRMLFGN